MADRKMPSLEQFLPALYELQTLETLPRHYLDLLEQLLPGDSATYNEVNLRRSRLVNVQSGSLEMNPALLEAFQAHVREHPVLEDYRRTRVGSARAISDFLSVGELRRTGLYQEFLRRLGIEDQMSVTLSSGPGTVVALTTNRGRRYAEDDRILLDRLRPHLRRCYENAEALTRLREELARAYGLLEEMRVGVVALDRRRRIVFMNGNARRLLASLGGTPRNRLPKPLREWVDHGAGAAEAGRGRGLGSSPFQWATPRATLVANLRPQPGGGLLLSLDEHVHGPAPEPLQGLGLTPREAEVLWWVAEGKTNAEIGSIVQASGRTVQKHLERVFVKLGVENRTAAAARANEAANRVRV